MSDAAPLLEVRNLRTYFDTPGAVTKAVDGIDLTIDTGKIVGVVGESGSGKSVAGFSIMRLIQAPGRIQPGSSIRYKGRDLVTEDEPSLRALRGSEIAMIFQEPMTSLNPVYRVGDQIAENLQLHRPMSRKAARARAIELLGFVGIPSPERRVDAYPHQLSGGMRQRVMIAMALTCEPSLLIADEPTTALDVTIQAQILELMLDLRDRMGMSVMFITHDLGVVAEICDEVVVMYAGRVVEKGSVAEVMRNPAHPYTSGLLACIPRLDTDKASTLNVIPGTVPSPKAWPEGCRFANRCPHAHDRCRAEAPPLVERDGHAAACWLVGTDGRFQPLVPAESDR